MSSTKRGKSVRAESDNYQTPIWSVHRLLEQVPLPAGRWADPGAGTGNLVRAVNMFRRDVEWKTYELREECREMLEAAEGSPTIGSFLDPGLHPEPCDVVFMNPPYGLAQEFVEKSLTFAGKVVALLRLNYLGASKRNGFMRERCPDVYVLPNRPSFTETGKTDSIEYAWMIWDAKRPQAQGILRVLADTPKAERL